MKILVAIKRVLDYSVKVKIKPDQTDVDLTNLKMAINPFCEIAVEAALKLRERINVEKIEAVTVGDSFAQETCRHALAMGVDSAIHVYTEDNLLPLTIARILANLAIDNAYDLVILGKQAIDDDNNQTGQMLAGLLKWPQATFASKITPIEDKKFQVTREVDGGLEDILVDLPAVITTDLRLNQPRYITLPNIMKAKNKPINKINFADMAIETTNSCKLIKVTPPIQRKPGKILSSVSELVTTLQQEGIL